MSITKSNEPAPKRRGKPLKYDFVAWFRSLKATDLTGSDAPKSAHTLYSAAKQRGFTISVRKIDGGFRVWVQEAPVSEL